MVKLQQIWCNDYKIHSCCNKLVLRVQFVLAQRPNTSHGLDLKSGPKTSHSLDLTSGPETSYSLYRPKFYQTIGSKTSHSQELIVIITCPRVDDESASL